LSRSDPGDGGRVLRRPLSPVVSIPKRRLAGLALVAVSLALFPRVSESADPKGGRAKAAACVVCHGQAGISVLPNAPNLAGQPAIYLEEQLRNYRSGKRQHDVMSVVAKPLGDADIEELAAWYASIRIEAAAP
jgi:cytochrome c553